jgi:hypothetical protein
MGRDHVARSHKRERMEIFRNDDCGYRHWLYSNPGGYVVNAVAGAQPGEPVLHRALCDTISPIPDKKWTGEYLKACSTERFELEQWVRASGAKLVTCAHCSP